MDNSDTPQYIDSNDPSKNTKATPIKIQAFHLPKKDSAAYLAYNEMERKTWRRKKMDLALATKVASLPNYSDAN